MPLGWTEGEEQFKTGADEWDVVKKKHFFFFFFFCFDLKENCVMWLHQASGHPSRFWLFQSNRWEQRHLVVEDTCVQMNIFREYFPDNPGTPPAADVDVSSLHAKSPKDLWKKVYEGVFPPEVTELLWW